MEFAAGPTLATDRADPVKARSGAEPQRSAPLGNQALLRRLQAKLTIGAVDDPLEHEADAVAEQVMRMPNPSPPTRTSPPRISRKCAACEEDESLQPKSAGADIAQGEAPDSVGATLGSPGHPLDADLRGFFEPRFGVDFSGVRVHRDDPAGRSARDVGAKAYTVGKDLVFAPGAYAPNQDAGRRLIAHELTHVVQQSGGNAAPVRRDTSPPPSGGAGPAPEDPKAQAARPSGSINITEDLFEKDSGGAGQLQASRDPALGPTLRRQAGIPPPPPAYPAASEWFFDFTGADVDFASLFGLTCGDGRERGFFVMWNEQTNKSTAGPIEIGEPAKGGAAAHIELGDVPADRKPIYPVGWFHTHPLANPGYHKSGVGPSALDQQTSKNTGLPGMLMDTKTPTSSCKDSGYFFFGPKVRS